MKNQLPFYFRMFIALGYIILGIIAVTTPAGEMMTGRKIYGIAFAVLCIGYGLFRAYRNVKQWDRLNHEQ